MSEVERPDDSTEGSHYEHEDEYDSDSSLLSWESDEERSLRSAPVLFNLAIEASRSGDWDPVRERLRTHREEFFGGVASTHPTLMHLFSCLDSSPEEAVLREAVGAFPEALRIPVDYKSRLPLHVACERMGEGKGLSYNHIRIIAEAYPEASAISDQISGNLPLHFLCMFKISIEHFRLGQLSELLRSIEFLLDMHPKAVLAKNKRGFSPINCISSAKCFRSIDLLAHGIESEWSGVRFEQLQSSAWQVYTTVLRETCRALYPKVDAERVSSLLLHAAFRVDKSNETVARLMRLQPDLALSRDSDGRFPLSFAACAKWLSAANLETVVRLNPVAASSCDHDGRFPLHGAIETTGKDWAILECIINAEPRVLGARDMKTHLYPFMLAAVSEISCLDNVYKLLLEDPLLAGGLADGGRGITQLERGRDKWTSESDALSDENTQ